MLADEVALTYDARGWPLAARLLPEAKRGAYRLISATDPDATFRTHGQSSVLGYNVSLAVTRDFVLHIQAATGAQPDSVAVPELIAAQVAHYGSAPPKLIYDQAAGSGKRLHEVRQASDGQTQLVVRMVDYAQRSDRFGPDDFTLSDDGTTLTCPNGQSSTRRHRSGNSEADVFRFSAKQCAGCPLWDKCRGPQARSDAARNVTFSDYRPLVADALAYQRTDAFAADMRLRPEVERIIAALVLHNGARRAVGYGLDNANWQARQSALGL